jgi:hypothetical protein
MVWDASLGRVVAFGGSGSVEYPDYLESYFYSGASWVLGASDWMNAPSGPPARAYHGMAYDPTRGCVIVFGGASCYDTGNGACPLGDTWELHDTVWEEEFIPNSPSPRHSHAMVYSAVAQGVISLGGPLADSTWLYQSRSELPDESCRFGVDTDGDGLVGCDDPDCWGYCSPLCPIGTTCPAGAPTCGDGVCSSLESCRLCPADCGACTPLCGDFLCDAGETSTSCPGDCPL